MKTPIPNFKPFIPKESIEKAVATLKTDWIGGDGPQVKKFEVEIAKIINNKNVLALNSGTSALQLALRLAGVSGGEVVTTPMTCFATSAAIVNEGATPIWADINPQTGNIDPIDVAQKITKKTKAIMAVHWGGAPSDLDQIDKIASNYNLLVIEDAAQALGSEYAGKPIGSHSNFIAFSTQAIKILNTIDGGLLATKKSQDAKRAKILRWYGVDREQRKWDKSFSFWDYPIVEIGTKAQMTDVAAAIGLGQISYLKKHIARRRKIAKLYEDALLSAKTIKAQKIAPNAKSNYWMFTVICNNQNTKVKLAKAMTKISVRVEEAHRRNDLYPVFKKIRREKLPGVDHFDKNHLIVPVGHWVSKKSASLIAKVLAQF